MVLIFLFLSYLAISTLRPISQSYTSKFQVDMPDESSGALTSFVQKTFEHLYESYDPNEEPEFLDSLFAHKAFPEKSALQAELEAELGSGESIKPGLDIRINHNPILLPGLKDYLVRAREGGSHAKVIFKDVFEVPEEGGGIVAGFFTVTRNLKFRIRAGPAQRIESVSFSAKLERTAGDDFRIIQLYITTVNKAAPIHLHGLFGSDSTHAAGREEEASINPALLEKKG
ncbi:uncharacterized protein LACBIDRAFT_327502 [Laccaria bicolor S238N-H82]|uniref:Predicted protein n=1 Tax=Laccaria bicolor (strain S238N-H82 / ATCC MYA-4686) TaxID=486041 RepID=B0DBX4_LACBS|nr:uncharacterized protein LACBIDRAFT_327502 [Laccaria bicolor S238N-H82]EDR07635.1 predicted protein [Laccaria bicolor S238N-H82]|eukprot:XP_001881424.1 predicted protein [Laccaria bicolor S238N-H82]